MDMFLRQEAYRMAVILILSLLLLGIVTGLWENPIFTRKIEVTVWDYVIFIPYTILLALYFGMKRQVCKLHKSKVAIVLGFFGFACPTCNAILIMLFGSSALVAYFEPIRPLIGMIGVVIMVYAVYQKYQLKALE